MTNLTIQNASQLEKISNGVSIRSIDDVSRMSKMFATSGFFADCRDAAQAGVKIMAGQEIGIPPFAAMNGIHIISGKAAVGSGLMAGLLKSSHKYNYRIKTHTNILCEIEIYELINGRMESIGISSFSIDDARKAGCKNLDKYARNMLFARAISNAIRFYAPDLFLGGGAVYTPEELGATVNEDGEIIEVEEIRVEPRKTITPKAVQSAVTQQIDFFRRKVDREGSEIGVIAKSLNLPSSSSEMTTEQALILIRELLVRFAVEDYDYEIDRKTADSLVSNSIMRTNTDTALWDDFIQSLEANESDNAA